MTTLPPDTPDHDDAWLTLSQAARFLDVHPTTLRRWANNGDLPAMVTPGRHRRFAATDLARFARERSALRNVHGIAGLWATKALAQARQGVVTHRRASSRIDALFSSLDSLERYWSVSPMSCWPSGRLRLRPSSSNWALSLIHISEPTRPY